MLLFKLAFLLLCLEASTGGVFQLVISIALLCNEIVLELYQ